MEKGLVGGKGGSREASYGATAYGTTLPWREMVMAWSHELRSEEIRSGGFQRHSEVMGAVFADGFGCESKRGGVS